MSGFESNPGPKTFTAGEAIAPNLRVALNSSGQAVLAGASERGIGTAVTRASASGEQISVALFTAGTHRMVAAAAIPAIDSTIYAAASGKVDDSGTVEIGLNLETSGADGEKIEVVPITQS